jgi:predicted dehydrogenase
MRRLRVGCIGTGFIAGRHLQALARIPGLEIVAVADAVRERAEAMARSYGCRAYDDGLALLAAEELDAVWLCVPPFAHGPLEAAALDRGLPFFVEKPLALDLATAVEVADRVQAQGLTTAVGYHWRHLNIVDSASRAMRDIPAQLVLGYWLDATPAAPWWWRRGQSGGQLLEQSTHIFDLARLLVGEVETVDAIERAVPRASFDGADVPTSSTVRLLFDSGAIGTIASTCVLSGRHRVGLHIIGDGLMAELSENSLTDHELRLVTAASDNVQRSSEDPIEREDREFVDALLGRAHGVRVPYAEALRTHALAWAADRSAREGVPVKVAGELPTS